MLFFFFKFTYCIFLNGIIYWWVSLKLTFTSYQHVGLNLLINTHNRDHFKINVLLLLFFRYFYSIILLMDGGLLPFEIFVLNPEVKKSDI